MTEPLTAIYVVLNQFSPAEHSVCLGIVHLRPEDARMQEINATPE